MGPRQHEPGPGIAPGERHKRVRVHVIVVMMRDEYVSGALAVRRIEHWRISPAPRFSCILVDRIAQIRIYQDKRAFRRPEGEALLPKTPQMKRAGPRGC